MRFFRGGADAGRTRRANEVHHAGTGSAVVHAAGELDAISRLDLEEVGVDYIKVVEEDIRTAAVRDDETIAVLDILNGPLVDFLFFHRFRGSIDGGHVSGLCPAAIAGVHFFEHVGKQYDGESPIHWN